MTDWIIVGAGFTGATLAERIATELNKKVLVIDRRDHIAGNAYDYPGKHGILVHKYGPHIFHTNSKKVWDYLSQFTGWEPYYHHVLAVVEGKHVPLPFNLNTIAELFPPFMAETLSRKLIAEYGYGQKVPILKLRESKDADLAFIADYVYRLVFKNYTFKQWELTPEELDPSVTARVPIYISRDDRYFNDTYQAMPLKGYTKMFEKMLSHKNITIKLKTEFNTLRDKYPEAKVIFTGPIDEYFAYSHGALPYRSLRFEEVYHETQYAQPSGTVNYPNEFDFTRITELKRLGNMHANAPGTILVREYAEAYVPGKNEPYYPIPTKDTSEKLKPYQELAKQNAGKVWFAGRLGDYAYYNMDQACARALALFEKSIAPAA